MFPLFGVGNIKKVLDINFNILFVVSRLFAYYTWKYVCSVLEDYFHYKVLINPVMADKGIDKT